MFPFPWLSESWVWEGGWVGWRVKGGGAGTDEVQAFRVEL